MISIRQQYDSIGIQEYYSKHSNDYSNPHYSDVISCLEYHYNKNRHVAVFDFACGDGLVSKWIGNNSYIIGNDCYLKDRYMRETGNGCYGYSFNDFIKFSNAINESFDLTIISYALDLCDKEIVPMLLYRLALISNELLIIRPNKHLLSSPYWLLTDTNKIGKSNSSLYKSTLIY